MRRVCATLALLLTIACGGGDSNSPKSVSGTYQLQTVNGASLPGYITNTPTYSFALTGGSLTINGDQTFSNRLNWSENDNGSVSTGTLLCTGTYARNGNSLSLTEATTANCGGSYTATWDGSNHLTVAYDASTQAVYGR